MKRKITLITMVFVATLGVASAQNGKGNRGANQYQQKTCYLDANKNGVCDKYESGECQTRNAKGSQNCTGKGQGKRDGSGQANGGKGTNYVDANKNGICDNTEVKSKHIIY